ncbi:hypothetical protein AKG43_09705 [Neisseria sp. 74A18]|nr:hypothetical protein AKG43_09705 [Neisseria sp. 74A18]
MFAFKRLPAAAASTQTRKLDNMYKYYNPDIEKTNSYKKIRQKGLQWPSEKPNIGNLKTPPHG